MMTTMCKWERRPGENGPALVRVFGPQSILDHDLSGERAKVPGGAVTLARRMGEPTSAKPGYPLYVVYEATDCEYSAAAEASAISGAMHRANRAAEDRGVPDAHSGQR